MAAVAGSSPASSNSPDISMLFGAALGFANHLLDGEAWARARLQPFAGQNARFVCGPFDTTVTITHRGTFAAATGETATNVTLTLPPDAPWRALAGDRDALIGSVQINGAADLAESLGFVLRHLRWDVEDDIAPLVGDIAARRLVAGGRVLANGLQTQAQRLAENFGEYFTEENPLLVGRAEMRAFGLDLERTVLEIQRLEQRLGALGNRRG